MSSAAPSLERRAPAALVDPSSTAPMRRRAKNAVAYLLIRTLLGATRALPSAALPALFAAMARLGALLARRERGRALRNLEAASIDRRGLSARRLWTRSFALVGRGLGECLQLWRGGRAARSLAARVQFAPGSLDRLQSAVARGRGVILAGAHFGNWELLASALARHLPLHVLARPSYDPRLSRLLERVRERLGCQTIWVRGGRAHLRHCLAALSAGEGVALALDQPARAGAQMIPFLGRPAPTGTVAPALAHRSGAALLLVLSERVGGTHRVVVEEVFVDRSLDRRDASRRSSAELAERLGAAVARRPDHWLWSLDRWREES